MDSVVPAFGLTADPRLAADTPDGGAGVVHDLGNLIQIAASALNLIARSPLAGRDAALEPLLSRAGTALERAGVLVRQTMGQTREATVVVRRVADAQDVSDCLHEIRGLVDWVCQPDVRFSLDVAPNLPPVRCNRVELQSAVLNLVLNARDAMPKRGALRLSVRAVRDGVLPAEVEIRVVDDGLGMSPETQRCAFNPFFTTKGDAGGTGLGLAMVRRFAHDAGGRVEIASALGAGTTVKLWLPAQTA